MADRYPNQPDRRTVSYGANNLVVALSALEVAKIFWGDPRSDMAGPAFRAEAQKLKVANSINDLLVRFVRLDYDDAQDWDMLVMERLYPLDFRSPELSKRELLIDVFEDELHQLHCADSVHRDIKRPSNQSGERYDNVFLTDGGLRLIDAGTSALQTQVGDKLFGKYREVEEREIAEFRAYFLSR